MNGHVVIAGTGRAGTTFLHEWLCACGLDGGTFGDYYPEARAGREHALTPGAPRLVKDPWLFSYVHTVDLAATPIDLLIVPVRDLVDSAESRIRQELDAVAAAGASSQHGWLGLTAGGMIHDLDVARQAETLAVGFHLLLEWATRNDIPTMLLPFPRLVDEPGYLVSRWSEWSKILPCDRTTAYDHVLRLAHPDYVRSAR